MQIGRNTQATYKKLANIIDTTRNLTSKPLPLQSKTLRSTITLLKAQMHNPSTLVFQCHHITEKLSLTSNIKLNISKTSRSSRKGVSYANRSNWTSFAAKTRRQTRAVFMHREDDCHLSQPTSCGTINHLLHRRGKAH